MAGVSGLKVHVYFAWWVKPYTSVLLFFCRLYRIPPDYEKYDRVLKKGIRVRVAKEEKHK